MTSVYAIIFITSLVFAVLGAITAHTFDAHDPEYEKVESVICNILYTLLCFGAVFVLGLIFFGMYSYYFEDEQHSVCCTCENCAANPEELEAPAGYILVHGRRSGRSYIIKADDVTGISTSKSGTATIYYNGYNGDELATEETYNEIVKLLETAEPCPGGIL